MALSNPATIFGLHQATVIDRSSYAQFAMRVLGDFGNDNAEELIPLQGGSSPYPWDTAGGYAEGKIPLTIKQYDLNILKYFAGYNGTTANYTEDTNGDAAGAASALSNKYGTSVFNATTGIASASVVSGNPVFGDYYIKAASSTTVNVYLNNNLDGVTYVDDTLKITSSALTITSGGNVTVPGTNLQLTGGSGTIGMTTGDIAKFSAKPINAYNFEYQGGGAGVSKPEFTLVVFFEKLGSDKYRYIEYPRVKANGVSFKGAEKQWATFDSELMILFDSTLGYAWKFGVINVA